jgi:hypothetical protein
MTYLTLAECRTRTDAYEAREDRDDFDPLRLIAMKSGCAHRRDLEQTNLEVEQRAILEELLSVEPSGLFDI